MRLALAVTLALALSGGQSMSDVSPGTGRSVSITGQVCDDGWGAARTGADEDA